MVQLFAFLILFLWSVNSQNIFSRLYQADPVATFGENSSKEYPYVIEITLNRKHWCGGALVRKDLVLTAAHCFPSYTLTIDDYSRYHLLAGNVNIASRSDPEAQYRNVKTVKRHENADNFINDIALVQADAPFYLTDYVQVVNLPYRSNSPDKIQYTWKSTIALGWGEIETGGLSTVLRKMNAIVQKKCIFCWSPDQQLCIKGSKKGVICGGDSGGPQVLHNSQDPSQDILIGLMHRGFDKIDKVTRQKICFGSYIVTKVVYFIDWFIQKRDEIDFEDNPNLSKRPRQTYTQTNERPKRDCECEITVRRDNLGDVDNICYNSHYYRR